MGILENDLFLGKTSKRTLFNLTTRSGVDIGPFSMYRKEKEILLLPGIRLQFETRLDQGDLQIIKLVEESGDYYVG